MHPRHPQAESVDPRGRAGRRQSNDRIFAAICAAASGYLLETATGEEILRGCANVLDGGGAMDRQIARRVLGMFSKMAAPPASYGLAERERLR